MEDSNLTRRQALGILGAGLALAAVPLSGCSGSAEEGGKTSSRKAGIILSGPANDGGWGQSHYESLKTACAERSGWQIVDPRENASPIEAADEAQSYVDQGVDLIIAAGTQFPDSLYRVVIDAAKKRPEVKFLFTNVSAADLDGWETVENLETVLPNNEQLGQVAGVVAGLMTSTNKIGFVAGMELSSSKEKFDAYLAAAKKVNASVEGFADYTAGYTEASQGRSVAATLIARDGVDVIWGDASAAENGVRSALEQAGADSHFNIAQPVDIAGSGQPTVIASTVVDWMIGQAMDRIESGEYGRGHVTEANLDNGGVFLGELSSKVPNDVKEKIEGYVSQIRDGKF